MTQIPAGWYPDPTAPPSNPPHLRYWDGAAWTEHAASPQPGMARPAPAGPTTPDGVPLAGWWWRVLAYVIDGFVIGIPAALAGLPAQFKNQSRINDLVDELNRANPDLRHFWHGYFEVIRDQLLYEIPVVVLSLVYFALMLRWKGASLGQLAVGLRVRLRERPGQLPWSSIVSRVLVLNGVSVVPYVFVAADVWVAAVVLFVVTGVFGLVNELWPLWDAKRQALHDKVARTNVVKIG